MLISRRSEIGFKIAFDQLVMLVLLPTLVLNTACEEVFFYEPVPVNSKNLQSFPKSLRGTWIGDDEASDSCVITKYGYTYYDVEVWKMDLAEFDTVKDVEIIGERFYYRDSEDERIKSLRCRSLGSDSILIFELKIYSGILDTNIVLRRSESAYALNVKDRYWKVYRLELLPGRMLEISRMAQDDFKSRTDFSELCIHKKEEMLIASTWTVEKIEKFAAEGGFSIKMARLHKK